MERLRLAWRVITGKATIIDVVDYEDKHWLTLVAPSYDHASDYLRDRSGSSTRTVHIWEG